MIARPRGMKLPDTSHLCTEDAELLEALYIERNAVSRGELARVRWNAEWARDAVRVRPDGAVA